MSEIRAAKGAPPITDANATLEGAWRAVEDYLRADGSEWELRVGRFSPEAEYWADGWSIAVYPAHCQGRGLSPAAALRDLYVALTSDRPCPGDVA